MVVVSHHRKRDDRNFEWQQRLNRVGPFITPNVTELLVFSRLIAAKPVVNAISPFEECCVAYQTCDWYLTTLPLAFFRIEAFLLYLSVGQSKNNAIIFEVVGQ